MPKATRILPLSPYHNISTGDLVDELGTLKARIADLEAREKLLRAEFGLQRHDHRSRPVDARHKRGANRDG